MHKLTILIATVMAMTVPTGASAVAGTYSVLYQFSSSPGGGYSPDSLVALPSGSLVGSAVGGTLSSPHSVIFKLDPPLAGRTAWTYSVIYDTKNFPVTNQSFSDPNTFLTDQAGNIYGRSDAGPQIDAGTIYRLSPPAAGAGSWTCTILYHHYNLHGFNLSPERLVYIDHTAQHIYGLSEDWIESGSASESILGEQMFRLDLAAPATLSIISPVIINRSEGRNAVTALVPTREGAFYGATSVQSDKNTIFRVTPPGPGATQGAVTTLGVPTAPGGNVVEPASISVDLSDRIVGIGTTTSETSDGVAFELLPPSAPGSAWQSKPVYAFTSSPFLGLTKDGVSPIQILNHKGLFFGVTFGGGDSTRCQYGCGTLFELAAPAPDSTTTRWSERPVHQFGLTAADGQGPRLLVPVTSTDGTYALYGITSEGGSANNGTIFRYVP